MLFPYMQNGSFDLLCCHIYINMIRSVVHLAKREVSALQKNTNKMQIRSFGGAMGVQKSGHIEQWNNLREDTHKVSTYIYVLMKQ